MATSTYQFSAAAGIPNSALPLIVVTDAIAPPDLSPASVKRRFAANGWQGTWTYTVFDYWHFHLDGHEVLACVSGKADVGFGGEKGAGGIVLSLAPGDVGIVPAGVGHKRLSGSPDFRVVGAYPPGQNGAITRPGSIDVDEARARIARLDLPKSDPMTGETQGVAAAWRGSADRSR